MTLQRIRKSPTRPDTEVSQTFNSGVVQIFSTRDAAPVGHSPVVECTAKCTLRYEERRLGINRLYLSRQNQAEIVRVYPAGSHDTRDLMVKVTDPALLEATGGIVQGMSGSPILQDGRLVGAVTHVLVNDPTQGYGILAETMLSAAQASA